ncbi:hypothetical protein Sjap_013095 [Stephania japonica]|uniref:Small auxin up regulated protein n=1 Tax=Stephania japonica TaxID=461633 RepID=A0AAP0IXH0_9MAGN
MEHDYREHNFSENVGFSLNEWNDLVVTSAEIVHGSIMMRILVLEISSSGWNVGCGVHTMFEMDSSTDDKEVNNQAKDQENVSNRISRSAILTSSEVERKQEQLSAKEWFGDLDQFCSLLRILHTTGSGSFLRDVKRTPKVVGVHSNSMALKAKQILKLHSLVTRSQLSSSVQKGHLAVYVGVTEKKRFVVPVSYLNHPSFQDLLSSAEEEFGFNHPMGGLTITCQESAFVNLTSRLTSS